MKINPKIKVIGVGGSGCNAVSRMARCSIQGIELIAVNTDAQDLKSSSAHRKLQIGEKIKHGKKLAKHYRALIWCLSLAD
jgi:cell division protein FtsZ